MLPSIGGSRSAPRAAGERGEAAAAAPTPPTKSVIIRAVSSSRRAAGEAVSSASNFWRLSSRLPPDAASKAARVSSRAAVGDEAGAVEPEDRRIGGEPVGEGDPADERTPPTGGAATLFGDGERRADARRVGDFDPRRPEVRPENDRRTPPIISGASPPEPVRRRGQASVRTDVIGVVPSKFGGR